MKEQLAGGRMLIGAAFGGEKREEVDRNPSQGGELRPYGDTI